MYLNYLQSVSEIILTDDEVSPRPDPSPSTQAPTLTPTPTPTLTPTLTQTLTRSRPSTTCSAPLPSSSRRASRMRTS
eukprot:scaffold56019_cov29-Phaeocystis_antarctica.AAC.1